METDNSGLHEESFIWRILSILHRYLCIFQRFIMIKLYDERGQSMPPIDDRLLLESATSIAEMIRTKQVSAVQVMNAFIRRIKQINPLLNCVVDERYKDALAEAAEADKLIASNKYTVDQLQETKPFLGVPISTKDSIGVRGMIFSSGLWLRRNERAPKDAEVIRLMREAGAIPFVITNVPELCSWWESSNTIYGRARNPYDTNRIAGGSSGGEASLQASAGSPFGIGSDLAGSIRAPAFFNGIFGHKPSPYVCSVKGIWPNVKGPSAMLHASAVGPMCRHACDLLPMLKAMTGDAATDLHLDRPVDLSQLNYFYQEHDNDANFAFPVEYDVQQGMQKVIQYFQNKFEKNVKQIKFEKLKYSMSIWDAHVRESEDYGFDSVMANLNGRVDPFAELMKWCLGMSKHTFPVLWYSIYQRFAIQYGTPEHQSKLKDLDELRCKFDKLLGINGVFIYLTHSTVAPYHRETILMGMHPILHCTAIFNALGFPSTAVPLGIGPSERLPIGLQIVANRNQDRLCLAVAQELERAFGGWVAPEIIA